jgi:hypothetical protein
LSIQLRERTFDLEFESVGVADYICAHILKYRPDVVVVQHVEKKVKKKVKTEEVKTNETKQATVTVAAIGSETVGLALKMVATATNTTATTSSSNTMVGMLMLKRFVESESQNKRKLEHR